MTTCEVYSVTVLMLGLINPTQNAPKESAQVFKCGALCCLNSSVTVHNVHFVVVGLTLTYSFIQYYINVMNMESLPSSGPSTVTCQYSVWHIMCLLFNH